jgi:hypothetical protein
MNHEEIRHKLSEFIDGAVAPGAQAEIEHHLKTCSECSEALRELRSAVEHIHAVEEVDAPAWMTQKIMAKVREERDSKRGLWQRVFAPVLGHFPVQAVAVLFLAVTAFYIYHSIKPTQKYTEEPVGMVSKKEAPAGDHMREKDAAVRDAVPKAKQAPGKPDYKSLDMKYAYEKPAPPAPQDRSVASAPAPAKEEKAGKPAAAPRTAAPSFITEQAAPSTGAVRQPEARREALSEELAAKKAFEGDREAETLLEVTEHFVKVDLPENMKRKGLRYHTRKFDPGLTDLRWMGETKTFRASPCSNRYVVDVDLSGRLAKYLYCYDRSRIRLLGVYELRQDGWTEQQR